MESYVGKSFLIYENSITHFWIEVNSMYDFNKKRNQKVVAIVIIVVIAAMLVTTFVSSLV